MLEPITCIFDEMDKNLTVSGIVRASEYYRASVNLTF